MDEIALATVFLVKGWVGAWKSRYCILLQQHTTSTHRYFGEKTVYVAVVSLSFAIPKTSCSRLKSLPKPENGLKLEENLD